MNSRILMVFGKLMIKLKSVIGIGRFEIMGGGGGGGGELGANFQLARN